MAPRTCEITHSVQSSLILMLVSPGLHSIIPFVLFFGAINLFFTATICIDDDERRPALILLSWEMCNSGLSEIVSSLNFGIRYPPQRNPLYVGTRFFYRSYTLSFPAALSTPHERHLAFEAIHCQLRNGNFGFSMTHRSE
ncbi:unnamed protein product [Albugo candida]|uniref:Uncharacterized protein n=1 Tax=Albugo candida TaxID=65357 RepID=A0A024FTC2_9STRA|nr:unnamed protein product [Albugo candida]|eukprot:CCI10348.1 unnamed protein product [Albugo candida]